MERVILFGASRLGEIAYEYLNNIYDISCFLDNDTNKKGKKIYSKSIINTDDLKKYKDNYIIISSQYDIEIAKQLICMGIVKFGVFKLIDNEEKYIVNHYDYSNINSFNIKGNKIALVVENNSGSNTLALSKNKTKLQDECEVVTIFEKNRNNNYYYDMLTSKVIIRTHDGPYNMEQINIQLWHGFPLKGLSYMSSYKGQNKEKNHVQWSKIDLITSYSQTYSTVLNSCYGVDADKYKVTGMPRNDLLFLDNGRENIEKIFSINLCNKKVIFYAPTFRKSLYGEKNGEIKYNDVDYKLFDQFLENNDLVLMLKFHPIEENRVSNCDKFKNIFILKEENLEKNQIDLYEVLNGVDLLITDYSSIYFDYLLLNRPIIFYPLDLESYNEQRGFLLEPYDFWTPGAKCYNQIELEKEMIENLYNTKKYINERQIIRSIVHKYTDNNSSNRCWDVIRKKLEGDR